MGVLRPEVYSAEAESDPCIVVRSAGDACSPRSGRCSSLVGCVLPWFAATGGDTGLTPITTNAFSDKGIVVFICALAVLALVSLPYAAGDKPLALDRALSYGIVLAVGRRRLRLADARVRPDRPGRPPTRPRAGHLDRRRSA